MNRDEIEKLTAVGLRIKDLEWEDSSARHRIVLSATSSAGVYHITQRYFPEEMFTLEKANRDAVNLPTLAAAKAAAQADYEARILAALEVTP